MIAAMLLAAALCPHPHRSRSVIEQFKKTHPCPASCRTYVIENGHFRVYQQCGACAVDHVCPRASCGKDEVANLQWLDAAENRKKSDDPAQCTSASVDWASVDVAIERAARKTDEMKAAELRKLREELDAIVKRNREAFERGER